MVKAANFITIKIREGLRAEPVWPVLRAGLCSAPAGFKRAPKSHPLPSSPQAAFPRRPPPPRYPTAAGRLWGRCLGRFRLTQAILRGSLPTWGGLSLKGSPAPPVLSFPRAQPLLSLPSPSSSPSFSHSSWDTPPVPSAALPSTPASETRRGAAGDRQR